MNKTNLLCRLAAIFSILFFTSPVNAQNISTVAGTGTSGYSGDGGAATSAGLTHLFGLAFDTAGNYYLADGNDGRVRKVNIATGIITTVAGTGTLGYSGDGGDALLAKLNHPTDIALDDTGNIYVSDDVDHCVRKITIATNIITTIAGTGTAGYSGDGGASNLAKINHPYGVTVDDSNNIYIPDYYNHCIRKITASTGIITTVAGTPLDSGYSGDGAAATAAELFNPTDVAFDASHNMYIADEQNDVIRKVDATTGFISTVAGDGSAGYSGDGGTATDAELFFPYGVSFDSTGNMYIADYVNNRVRMVDLSGNMSTVAGNGTLGYSGDGGLATDAELYYPLKTKSDKHGNLYIADAYNSVVRMVNFQCTGATAGSIASSGGTSFCGSGVTTLTLPTATATGIGISYQFESSTDGTTWLPVGTDTNYYAPGLLTATTYFKAIVRCAASASADSTIDTITVNPIVTPTITLSATPGDTICSGTMVTFTATITNGGTTPHYHWLKNGLPVGTDAATYTDGTLVAGDIVKAVLASSMPCATPASDTSAGLSILVNSIVTPGVTITASPNDTICAGTSVTFIATATYGGSAPHYQWIKDGSFVGTDASTYTDGSLADGDNITCQLTSNAPCATATLAVSNLETVHVIPTTPPTVTITASPDTIVTTPGATISFAASVSDGGTPTYQWLKNGVDIPGATLLAYASSSLVPGDMITCIVHSSIACASPDSAISNTLTLHNPASVAQITSSPIDFYPNPNDGTFTVAGNINNDAATIEVLNMVGQVVYKDVVKASNGRYSTRIALSGDNASGVYILHIKTTNDNYITHFVIKK